VGQIEFMDAFEMDCKILFLAVKFITDFFFQIKFIFKSAGKYFCLHSPYEMFAT